MRSLEEIKLLRKKYNLTQKELSNLAQVSQSLIAKIEAGKLDPTYSKAVQIFSALENLREQKEIKAQEIMHRRVFFAQPDEPLQKIIKSMKEKGISQVPILEKEKVIGIITEANILNQFLDHPERINFLKCKDVMEESPPIISLATGLKMILELLRYHPVVLVAEKGEIKGIISKSDLLGKV